MCVCVCFGEGQMRGQGGPQWADHLSLQSPGLCLLVAGCWFEADGDREHQSGAECIEMCMNQSGEARRLVVSVFSL